jgi:hypothetical protein
VVTAESSFAALELLEAVRAQVAVVTRLRLDAALYDLTLTLARYTTGIMIDKIRACGILA